MMIRLLAYFVPFAINFLSGGFMFISGYRFSEENAASIIVSCAVAAWGISYCAVSMLAGKAVTKSNMLTLILSGGIILMLTAGGFICFTGLYTQLIWLIFAGTGAALFCTPFQLLAKQIESGKAKTGAIPAASFYTMTWSVGFASGPLAFANVRPENGFIITFIMAAAVTVSVILIAVLLRKKRDTADTASQQSAADEEEVPASEKLLFPIKSYDKTAILGWIIGGLGTITICQIRAMWPKIGTENSIPQHHIAYIMALVSYSQALTALLLVRSKDWMYRRIPASVVSGFGAAAFVMFICGESILSFYLAALLFGVYSGSFYFCLVYHSLVHPERSKFFVTGNEVIVGIVSMTAPLAGGFLADLSGYTGAAFIFALVICIISLLIQLCILNPEKLAEG